MLTNSLTKIERSAIISLSTVMGLRMIGLFMVLPVFSLYALALPGATPTLVGIATGVYGLCQAIFQILFGALSDHHGRKPIIIIGLSIFIIGCLIASYAKNIEWMIAGRALQGIGAIGGTILATMADLTREDQRTKAMMIAGMTIGFSFSLAMLLGPVLAKWFHVSGLFILASALGAIAILILCIYTPTPKHTEWHREAEPEYSSFKKILFHPELAKLNSGIFLSHAIFTANFVVIPISLFHSLHLSTAQQWHVYLPTLLLGSFIALASMRLAEKRNQVHGFFILSIISLIVAEICLANIHHQPWLGVVGLCIFFAGFSLLEAFLPSLVSRTAPPSRKGSALGVYSCSQFLGIFVGGVLGGWMYGQQQTMGVYLLCSFLAFIWFIIASFSKPLQRK